MTTYELYYDNGGHGGPYANHADACAAAERLLWGCRSMRAVEVRPRNSSHTGGYDERHHGSTYVQKNAEGLVTLMG